MFVKARIIVLKYDLSISCFLHKIIKIVLEFPENILVVSDQIAQNMESLWKTLLLQKGILIWGIIYQITFMTRIIMINTKFVSKF